jgi:hypothetical protein
LSPQAANVASTLARIRNIADAGGLSFNSGVRSFIMPILPHGTFENHGAFWSAGGPWSAERHDNEGQSAS